MTIFMLFTSITSMVLNNSLLNRVCKKSLKTDGDVALFNVFCYAVCILMFGILLLGQSISLYTVVLGLLFGITTAVSNMNKMLALSAGPMHITNLVTTSSMIIPALSGVFFGESLSIYKLITIAVLIFFIYMSLDRTDGKRINKKWLVFTIIAFIFQGAIGVLQKIHQTSAHKSEVAAFLLVSFLCSAITCLINARVSTTTCRPGKKFITLSIICGICVFLMNYINLKLSGLLPTQLFFPLVNGSSIILSSAVAVIIFKERLTKKQAAGLIGGIISLIAICFVN